MDNVFKELALICMAVMFLSVIFLCAWMYPPLHEAKKMDCALAEFSPDISTEIKQLCREARNKR
jgi:short subunit fatty acids transporter